MADFSTNRHSVAITSNRSEGQAHTTPSRHPDISFDDGNVAILTGDVYFLVHQGLLARRSQVLEQLLKGLANVKPHLLVLEGRPVLQLKDSPEDMACLLLAFYDDGISDLAYDASNFTSVSGLLRLSTKYQVTGLRATILRGLSQFWPSNLPQWEIRDCAATDLSGSHVSRLVHPHPILIINLAREINAPQLLPSAFYDLSRFLPSDFAAGYIESNNGKVHQLSRKDLLNLLRGREHASRFLSTFIVNDLEGREPSASCLWTNDAVIGRRTCQVAFEAVTFELLCDVNGLARKRHSDPLYAILDAVLMQVRDEAWGTENQVEYRACKHCLDEFSAVVNAAREDFWHSLPRWFGISELVQ